MVRALQPPYACRRRKICWRWTTALSWMVGPRDCWAPYLRHGRLLISARAPTAVIESVKPIAAEIASLRLRLQKLVRHKIHSLTRSLTRSLTHSLTHSSINQSHIIVRGHRTCASQRSHAVRSSAVARGTPTWRPSFRSSCSANRQV